MQDRTAIAAQLEENKSSEYSPDIAHPSQDIGSSLSSDEIRQTYQQPLNKTSSVSSSFQGNDPVAIAPVSRQTTVLERVQTSVSFFNPKFKSERKRIALKVGLIYLIMATLCLGIFSIYWGSAVGRNGRLVNLKYLVVIEDNGVIGSAFEELISTPEVRHYGTFHIFNSSSWMEITNKSGRDSEQEIISEIHKQNYWTALYVKPDASQNWIDAVNSGSDSYNVSNSTINNFYETGRDFNGMNSYVTPNVKLIEEMWLHGQPQVTERLLQSANPTENSWRVISAPISFTHYDFVPFTDPVLVAPSQVGLIYMIIVTFFQINFFADIHKEVAHQGIKKPHYIIYRLSTAMISYLILSLTFGLVTIACQVDFTVTFGKSGFLVYWLIAFLTMIAVGTVNEIMALLLIMVYPPILGFWLLFWVISNITPAFVPIALSPEFYRYGYALPIYNS